MINQPPSPFAPNDDEAEALRRFNEYKSKDPFPDIAPALLNSADIYDYVAVTAMIHPFEYDPKAKKLKSASYGVPILGKIVYWDEKGEKQVRDIKRKESFPFKKNSIIFVTLEPMFRLPDYIALRFNLQITHVYRGILLGTGPLVDPGFTGRLSIPLHNLTNNDYTFVGGEDLIWIEFTKLSPNNCWTRSSTNLSSRKGEYREFRNDPNADIEDYLLKADRNRPIRSSIPEIVLNAKQVAEEAQQSAKESALKAEEAVKTADSIQKSIILRLTVGGILTAIATFLALYFTVNALTHQVNSLVQDSVNYVKTSREEKTQYETKIQTLEQEIKELKEQIKKLNKSNERTSNINNQKN